MSISDTSIRYQYAFDSGVVVNINDLTRADRKDYECISCGNVLRPILGEDRAKHFRHKSNNFNCSKETYLHRMGKWLFKKTYEDCLLHKRPYIIRLLRKTYCQACEADRQCEKESEWVSYNLTHYFNNIKEEVRDGQFIPDLLLTGPSGEKLYIEIAVTHATSDEKANSGIRIIEFSLKHESDFDLIRQCRLDADDKKLNLLNFKQPAPIVRNESRVHCSVTTTVFRVSPNGHAEFIKLSLYDLSKCFKDNASYISEINGNLTHNLFIDELEKAINSGYQVIDCSLCNHRHKDPITINSDFHPRIYCLKKSKGTFTSNAVLCQNYHFDLANLRPSFHSLEPVTKPQQKLKTIYNTSQAIDDMRRNYVNGANITNCFLCLNRDISGYTSKPEILIHCRHFQKQYDPDYAKQCTSFDPLPRSKLKSKIAMGEKQIHKLNK